MKKKRRSPSFEGKNRIGAVPFYPSPFYTRSLFLATLQNKNFNRNERSFSVPLWEKKTLQFSITESPSLNETPSPPPPYVSTFSRSSPRTRRLIIFALLFALQNFPPFPILCSSYLQNSRMRGKIASHGCVDKSVSGDNGRQDGCNYRKESINNNKNCFRKRYNRLLIFVDSSSFYLFSKGICWIFVEWNIILLYWFLIHLIIFFLMSYICFFIYLFRKIVISNKRISRRVSIKG